MWVNCLISFPFSPWSSYCWSMKGRKNAAVIVFFLIVTHCPWVKKSGSKIWPNGIALQRSMKKWDNFKISTSVKKWCQNLREPLVIFFLFVTTYLSTIFSYLCFRSRTFSIINITRGRTFSRIKLRCFLKWF